MKSLTEQKKGQAKITIDIEINEPLMEAIIAKMPEIIKIFRK